MCIVLFVTYLRKNKFTLNYSVKKKKKMGKTAHLIRKRRAKLFACQFLHGQTC